MQITYAFLFPLDLYSFLKIFFSLWKFVFAFNHFVMSKSLNPILGSL